LSGVIAQSNALAGQVVEARDILFEVVDPARLLVEVALTDVALGQQIAEAGLQGMPGVKLHVLGIGGSLREGALPVTFRAESGKAGALPLAVGQPVTVVVRLKERIKGIVLPAEAIVRGPANEPSVWIKGGAERFVPQPVQYRALDSQTVVVTKGLGPDNRVVVRGAALISQIR
jgi:membrane fusion protein, heavy metal efflux system